MADDTDSGGSSFGRALFTDRERAILSGNAEVKDNYRYKVESVARHRINKTSHDVEILRENYPELFDQLQEAVCDDE